MYVLRNDKIHEHYFSLTIGVRFGKYWAKAFQGFVLLLISYYYSTGIGKNMTRMGIAIP